MRGIHSSRRIKSWRKGLNNYRLIQIHNCSQPIIQTRHRCIYRSSTFLSHHCRHSRVITTYTGGSALGMARLNRTPRFQRPNVAECILENFLETFTAQHFGGRYNIHVLLVLSRFRILARLNQADGPKDLGAGQLGLGQTSPCSDGAPPASAHVSQEHRTRQKEICNYK